MQAIEAKSATKKAPVTPRVSELFGPVMAAGLFAALLLFAPRVAAAQTDCLSCHGDTTMTDSNGNNAGVDAHVFQESIHGSLGCNDCHKDIKEYPHPDHLEPVKCATCHAEEASALVGSVHASAKEHPCTSCHGDAHKIVPKSDPKSAVYPLNIPATCGKCHGDAAMSKKHALSNVLPSYLDSIHGLALSKEGLMVAANCQSCHGSHHVLSHTDPQSPTFKPNVPATCGNCHAGIQTAYSAGVHGKAVAAGNMKAPVCTDCHTAHDIARPTADAFRTQSTPICGNCHKDKFNTYRDTFHSQLGALGGYVETARCWDCHGAHEMLPASDPRSPVNPANLVKTCGKCHQGANASFVQYQPHANAHIRKLNPALYFIRLFMNVLLTGTLTFFMIHTLLWLMRSLINKSKHKADKGDHNA